MSRIDELVEGLSAGFNPFGDGPDVWPECLGELGYLEPAALASEEAIREATVRWQGDNGLPADGEPDMGSILVMANALKALGSNHDGAPAQPGEEPRTASSPYADVDTEALERWHEWLLRVRADDGLAPLIPEVDARYEAGGSGVSVSALVMTPGHVPVSAYEEYHQVLTDLTRTVIAGFNEVFDQIERRNDSIRGMVREYESMFDGDAVAWISERLGQAEQVNGEVLDAVDSYVRNGRWYVHGQNFPAAANALKPATMYLRGAVWEWNQFMADIEEGAEHSITVLEITRDTSFEIVAALATGGAGAVIESRVAGGLARGAARTAAAVGIKAATGVTKELVEQASEILLYDTRRSFAVDEMLAEGLREAAAELAGAPFAKLEKVLEPVGRKLAGPLADRVAAVCGSRAAALINEVLPTVLAQIPGDVAEAAVNAGVRVHFGRHFEDVGAFREEMAEAFASEVVENLAGSITERVQASALRFGGRVEMAVDALDREEMSDYVLDAFRRSLP